LLHKAASLLGWLLRALATGLGWARLPALLVHVSMQLPFGTVSPESFWG